MKPLNVSRRKSLGLLGAGAGALMAKYIAGSDLVSSAKMAKTNDKNTLKLRSQFMNIWVRRPEKGERLVITVVDARQNAENRLMKT